MINMGQNVRQWWAVVIAVMNVLITSDEEYFFPAQYSDSS